MRRNLAYRTLLAFAAACISMHSTAAALLQRDITGDGIADALYDSDRNITWLRSVAPIGFTNWAGATIYANEFKLGSYADWRLPTSDRCTGLTCRQSELSHLYYESLGNSVSGRNIGDFANLPFGSYWSGFDGHARNEVSTFTIGSGFQVPLPKDQGGYVLLVRDGDVDQVTVNPNPKPIPSTPWPTSLPTIETKDLLLINPTSPNAPPVTDPSSLGATARRVLDYYRTNSDHAALERNYLACENDPTHECDPDEFLRQAQLGYAKWARDLGFIAIDLNTRLQGYSIGAVAVDMSDWSSLWDSTALGKILSFGSFLGKIKSALEDAIDFFKSTSAPIQPRTLASSNRSQDLEPTIINSVVGSLNWGDLGTLAWQLADLSINVDIAKEYFQDLNVGQSFTSSNALLPRSTAYGVFTVNDFVDPPGYNTVTITLRQLDLIVSAIPEPATLPMSALAVLFAISLSQRRRSRTVPLSKSQLR